jgi:mannose-6-phosphate isomerase class I
MTLPWERFAAAIDAEAARHGLTMTVIHTRSFLAAPARIESRTLDGPLRDDPVFARLFPGSIDEVFDRRPRVAPGSEDVVLLVGPGAGLSDHDLLWVADHPKRLATDAVRAGSAAPISVERGDPDAARRLVFVDWPMLDRHRRSQLASLDRFIDLGEADAPRSMSGTAVRDSLRDVARGPFRTLPTFAPGPWGGQWMRETLGIETEAPNLAWSYELIAPESSLLLGDEPALEIGLEMLLAAEPTAVLGSDVERRFGGSFPIRFDYLDTMDGGNLSVHCHPRERYMQDVFGWDYTQHESYYVMATQPGARIFLGLEEDLDADTLSRTAATSRDEGVPFEIGRFVQAHPARQHRLYLIPAGTPHASSKGNVVLEISATPYLYSLRFYDWLREDLAGDLRPVQLEHAFANLDLERRGRQVRDELLPDPRQVRDGPGFVEIELGRHPELFFAIHRLDFTSSVEEDTAGRFHVLNLVDGDNVLVETDAGRVHRLGYAETILVPAAVGRYRLRSTAGGTCRVVKAFVG